METSLTIRATSDLHGTLPDVEPCDILLIGGDVCPNDDHNLDYQKTWLDLTFREWLEGVPAKHIVGIAGNHDFIFEQAPQHVAKLDLPWTYLQDSQVEIEGLTIYGLPWVPNLPGWAFYGGPNGRVSPTKVDPIPTGVDILLSHGPMHAYGDVVGPTWTGEPMHVGCKTMGEEIARIRPQAFVCGHIHEGYGHYRHRHVAAGIFNVAHNDELYRPVNPVVELSL